MTIPLIGGSWRNSSPTGRCIRSQLQVARKRSICYGANTAKAGSSLHILLAEDNLVNQMVAEKLLERQGHTVVVAPNGRSAIEEHAKGFFDLILMDVQMPEVGGFEATQAIRERERKSGEHIPII